jgi:hypothetical protein
VFCPAARHVTTVALADKHRNYIYSKTFSGGSSRRNLKKQYAGDMLVRREITSPIHGLCVRRVTVAIAPQTPTGDALGRDASHAEISLRFPQCLHANAVIAPRLGHDSFLSDPL